MPQTATKQMNADNLFPKGMMYLLLSGSMCENGSNQCDKTAALSVSFPPTSPTAWAIKRGKKCKSNAEKVKYLPWCG